MVEREDVPDCAERDIQREPGVARRQTLLGSQRPNDLARKAPAAQHGQHGLVGRFASVKAAGVGMFASSHLLRFRR